MIARILFITDMHKRWADTKTIRNLVPVQHKVQMDIVNYNKQVGVTHNIIAGDWYDRGFHGLGPAYAAMEEDRMLSNSVNGNAYLCIGNHFFLERDENPEMYIIQPCEYVKPRNLQQLAEKPIFQVVPKLKIGTVQISFFHFSKTNKSYVAPRDPDTTFHIGVYHDDVCVPGWIREREGFGRGSTSVDMMRIYENIDLAIHGHIHSDVGLTSVELPNGKKVPLWVPGSLGICQNKEMIKHTTVDLPLIDINENGTVDIHKATFNTYIGELQFVSTVKKSMEPKSLSDLGTGVKPTVSTPSMLTYLESRGFSDSQMRMVEEARSGRLNLTSAVTIVTGGAK